MQTEAIKYKAKARLSSYLTNHGLKAVVTECK